jgi:xanthine dehydrogenase YagT iron-sulfur-binding subunit
MSHTSPAHHLTLTVNGRLQQLAAPGAASLLDLLRGPLNLRGTKRGCDAGACGACTVLVDGQRVNACLTLAALIEGAQVTTVEGLPALAGAGDDGLHPLQQAFIACDALQCGYCTPGQLMSAAGLIAEGGAGSAAAIRDGMSGNLCRCGAYPMIEAAIAQAAGLAGEPA